MDTVKEFVVTLFLIYKAILVAIWQTIFPPPEKLVNGEIVLITGAGSGIGRLMAVEFAMRGAVLVLWDINEAGNKETKEMTERYGASVYAYTCDMSNKSEIDKTAERVRADVGEVNILINNAGIVTGRRLLDTADEMILKTIQVNLMAHFWTTKTFLPSMLERNHGHIVTMASMAGIVGTARMVDYCASKFGTVGLTEALDYEIAADGYTGVHTTAVCPSFISTGLFEGIKNRFEWLTPQLDPNYVAQRVAKAVLTNQRVIMLPRSMYIMAVLKTILPIEATAVLHKFLGASNMMDTFVGRQKKD